MARSVGVLAYTLLCGFPPFHGETPTETLASVRSRAVGVSAGFFPSPEWDGISAEAKRLLATGMLNRDPALRPTAAQLLEDPWLAANANTAPLRTMARLKRFNAKRKLRAAYRAMRATNRMAALAIGRGGI
jgi:serine/threonine protein kinase